MESHPSYPALAGLLRKYPRVAGGLFQVYNDITLGQQWSNVEVVELESCSRAAIKGRKPKSEQDSYVVPCSLSETISFGWLEDAFKQLGSPQEIFLGISTEDASIVYYKLSQGIVKPPV